MFCFVVTRSGKNVYYYKKPKYYAKTFQFEDTENLLKESSVGKIKKNCCQFLVQNRSEGVG
jgi:hypothetical protein